MTIFINSKNNSTLHLHNIEIGFEVKWASYSTAICLCTVIAGVANTLLLLLDNLLFQDIQLQLLGTEGLTVTGQVFFAAVLCQWLSCVVVVVSVPEY